jgi:hypothetical protein
LKLPYGNHSRKEKMPYGKFLLTGVLDFVTRTLSDAISARQCEGGNQNMSKKAINGYQFAGVVITENSVAVQVTLNQLEAAGLKSPYAMARTSLKQTDSSDRRAKELRSVVQRAWDKQRSVRADLYNQYLWHMASGVIKGSAPPPAIYSPDSVTEDDETIVLPFRSTLIAIDGETQLEARFRMREEHSETGDLPFPAILHHGIEESHAIQILHDYNRYAKPIPESKLGARNSSGGISATVLEAVEIAGLTDDDLNKSGALGTAKQVAGFSQAMHFVAGYSLGSRGLSVNGTAYFDQLNRPGAPPINSSCPNALASMLHLGASIADKAEQIAFRKMAAPFWQVAGVLASEGGDPATFNWTAAYAADKALGTAGRGGPRPSRTTRQRAIYTALKSAH